MILLQKNIKYILKYPLMWVMLLWALTLPGHEVIVYNFLLNIISGETKVTFTHVREEISRSNEQGENSHVFLDAAPASFAGKLQLQASFVLPGSIVFLTCVTRPHKTLQLTTFWLRIIQQQLLIAVLPNAP